LAEQRGAPRGLAQALVLGRILGDDRAAGCAHAVRHARAARFAEQDERHPALRGDLLHVLDLLHVDHGRRRAEHREVVRYERNFAAVDPREPRDLTVGRCLVLHLGAVAPRVASGFDEALAIDEVVDALARVQHAVGLALRELFGPAHRKGLGFALLQFLDVLLECHSRCPYARARRSIWRAITSC
jgi:hypothetical protein